MSHEQLGPTGVANNLNEHNPSLAKPRHPKAWLARA
jgi:hypothetical protein